MRTRIKRNAFSNLMLLGALALPALLGQPLMRVSVNGQNLTVGQMLQLRMLYGAVLPGCYWYDARSGLYGHCGREVAGRLRPGHRFAPLREDASGGDTGVFVNGRELPIVEVTYLRRLLGSVPRGFYWLNADGGYGVDGGPRLGSLFRVARGSGGSHRVYSPGELSGVIGGGGNYCTQEGNCVYTSR